MTKTENIKLKQISYQELLIEVQEMYEILHKLVNSDRKINSQISISLIPYLSFLSDGLDFFHEETKKVHSSWYKEIEGNTLKQLIKDSRSTLKLYSDFKENQIISNLEDDTSLYYEYLTRNYNFLQNSLLKLFGQHDLGIFYFRDIDYANTYQLFKNIKKIYIANSKKIRPLMKELAMILSNYIFKANNYPMEKSINKVFSLESDFTYKDVYFKDSKRFNAFNNFENKYWRLFIYNHYCQNNFIRYILPIILRLRGNFYYRMKFCSYLLSIKGLYLLSKRVPEIIREYPVINELIQAREDIIPIKFTLRNNLFHYNIMNIPSEVFEKNGNIFKQMVEYSMNRPFEKFDAQVNQELNKYQELIIQILF